MSEFNLTKMPEVLTVEEVARLLRIGRSAAYEAVRRGEIPSRRIGRRLIIPKYEIEKILGRRDDSQAR